MNYRAMRGLVSTKYRAKNFSSSDKHPALLLITPPFIRPTSPPLAPASLKGFLRQELPQANVRCMDLNLDYFCLAMKWLENGTIKLKLYDWDNVTTAQMVAKAFDFLCSRSPSPGNLREYHRQATIFLNFESIFNAFLSEMALRALTSAPLPSGITAFLDELCSPALSFPADIVGISILFDIQMPVALLLAAKIKQSSKARVVFGGAKFGVEPGHDRILYEPVEVEVKNHRYRCVAAEFIDGIISGEGEAALLHIMKDPLLRRPEEVPNFTFLQGEKIVVNPPEVMEDLDRLPCPDFSDFSLEKYMCPEKVLPLLTARGCPWGKCAFCTHHHSYRKYRQRSLDKVIEDMKYLQGHYSVDFFNFFDEMIPPGRFRRLAEAITQNELHICYSAYVKPVKGFDRKTLECMHDSGCRLLLWGVEAASQRVLDLMNKGIDIADAQEVIREAAGAGIKNLIFIMFGFPGETREEFSQTLSFLDRNKEAIHALSKGIFRLMEGSRIAENPHVYGLTGIREQKVPPFKSRLLIHEIAHGPGPEQVEGLFRQNLKKIEATGLTPRFGTYREHLLVYACKTG